jgi:hypothetical protein
VTLASRDAGRDLAACELLAVVRALARQPRVWRRLVHHDPHHRVFEQLRRDDHLDVWVICWNDDNDTGFHDHDISAGAVAVVDGIIIEERLAIGGPSQLRLHRPGQAFSFEASHVHRMRHDPAAPSAVTIHAYSPPLWRMGTYDVSADGTLRRTSISYAEELRPAAGAGLFGHAARAPIRASRGRHRLAIDADQHVGGLDHGGDRRSVRQAEVTDSFDSDRGHQAYTAGVQLDVGDRLARRDGSNDGRNLVAGA